MQNYKMVTWLHKMLCFVVRVNQPFTKKAEKAPLGDEDYSKIKRELRGIAFSYLISYMEVQLLNTSEFIPLFKLYLDDIGFEIILVSNRDIGDAISTATQTNYDEEGFILAKAASITRRYIFDE